MEDVIKILRRNEPAYILADLNARHRFVGHNQNNDAGNIINNMIERNMVEYIGPDFNTRVGHAGITRLDIILKNRVAFFNYMMREGELTMSDHIPILFKISTTAIIKEIMPRRQLKKANWELIKHNIENDMVEKHRERDLTGNPRDIDIPIIDDELKDWFRIIVNRIEEGTPKKSISYTPHPKESDLLKALQMAYRLNIEYGYQN